jgi:cytidyltransferase-like protein
MKDYKLAITFGRFNLLHNGHCDLFKQMADCSDEVIIGVSTGPENLTYRNRADVILKLIKNVKFGSTVGLWPKRQPFELADECGHVAPEDVIFFVGEDQHKLAKAIERVLGYTTRTIPRLTSSTAVRSAIDEEDWDIIASIVPPCIVNDVVNLHLKNA